MTSTGWAALAARISACRSCPELVASRQHVVVGDPQPAPARLVFVGEAPGAQEDAAGRPFVGKAGQLLDQLLTDAGLSRAEVGVLNVVKCRPPGNRTPTAAEVTRCRPYLESQLDLLAPRLVVALGLTAVCWFLGRGTRLAAARGRVHHVGGRRVLATYHPSAAIRFGPNGAPLAALRDDLALAARLVNGGDDAWDETCQDGERGPRSSG
ncbi:MAG TPA: uracil-DNA glycosylase [Micromonosporaceae bacterium]